MAPTVYSPPVSTYTALATTTLAATAASVTFGSIPATYRDLVVVVNAKVTSSAGTLYIQLNSDTGSNYSGVWMIGTGSSTTSGSHTSQTAFYVEAINDTDANYLMNLNDASATDKHKTIITRNNQPGNRVSSRVGRWADTSAVTSITIDNDSPSDFAIGSTFSLYGIEA